MEQYITREKAVGETPLQCLETFRASRPDLTDVPIAYAGRLDPMASGTLLFLIGAECKRQTEYHDLDKEYEFSVLFGIGSDTYDVLGRLACDTAVDGNELWTALKTLPHNNHDRLLTDITTELIGTVTLPYPHFSSKTVKGKPLHTWALENRIDEIDIPTKTSTIYELEPQRIEWITRTTLCEQAFVKIDTIPPVTDVRKALGNDFRRADVRADWQKISENDSLPDAFPVVHFRCTASSGTYMRTLAHLIAHRLGTAGLAWHIHRTGIGRYQPGTGWTQRF